MRCVWLTWSCLTLLSAILCTSGYILPYWIKGSFIHESKDYISDIGIYRRCIYPIRNSKSGLLHIVNDCGHYVFNDIPHLYWKICMLMLAISTCSLIFLTFLLFTLGFYVDLLKMTNVYKSCQFIQFISGVLILLSCILYPLGWKGNDEISQICGSNISVLTLGRCNVGMAFILTCTGGLIALLGTTIPVLLLRNGCMDVPSCDGTPQNSDYLVNYPASLPSTTRDGTVLTAVGGCSNTIGQYRPFSMVGQSTMNSNCVNGTLLNNYLRTTSNNNPQSTMNRYSYVSYQSLLPSNTSGNQQQQQQLHLLASPLLPSSELHLKMIQQQQQQQQINLMQDSIITMASSGPIGEASIVMEMNGDVEEENPNDDDNDDVNNNSNNNNNNNNNINININNINNEKLIEETN